jgi:predicted restriction endonuclease
MPTPHDPLGHNARFKQELASLSEILETRFVPRAFVDEAGERWKLDQGKIGHAVANGVLVKPDDSQQLWLLELITESSNVDIGLQSRMHGERTFRPGQRDFRFSMLRNYEGRCAITSCNTKEAVEAAHISTSPGVDDNALNNGLLLRRDIHALFDAHLITLSEDGGNVDISPTLQDPQYAFLRGAALRPPISSLLDTEKIRHHRNRFVTRSRRSQ